MDKNLNIRINKELLENYKLYCSKNGYLLSERIRNFIESELKPKLDSEILSKAVISRFSEIGISTESKQKKIFELFTSTLIEEIINALHKDVKTDL